MARLLALLPLLFLPLTAAAPPTTAVATLAEGEDNWVPFDLTPGNQIRFTMTINDQPAVAVLDTGVSVSVISRRFAAAARLKVAPRGSASAIGGQVPLGWTPIKSLGFGGMVRRGGGLSVVTLPALATGSASPVEVLVGHDLIDAYALDIDFDTRQFRLLKSGRLPFHGTSAPLSISRRHNVYVTEVTLAGRRLTPMVLDTGDGSSVTLSQESARAAAVGTLRTTTAIAFGLAGPLVTDLTILPSLSVGKLVARDVEMRIERRGGFSTAIGVAGRIGSGFLQNYRVLLDPGASHIIFAPTARTGTPPIRSTSGLLVATDKTRLRVLHVMRGSPAEMSGWRAEELICAIDGTAVPVNYNGSAISDWSVGSPGRTVALTLCDGSQRKLTLAHFY